MLEHDTTTPDVETATVDYAHRFNGPTGQFLLRRQASGVRRLLGSPPLHPLRVLDVGGGHAQLTALLLEGGSDVWVQGSDPSCAQRIELLAAASGRRLHFVASSLWTLPFPDAYFDIVVGIRLLAHVERWQELLGEMARVCRYRLMIDYPPLVGVNALESTLLPLKRRIEGNTRPYFSYMKGDLLRVLRCEGFQRFAVEKQFLVPMAVHRALRNPRLSDMLESTCRALGLTALLGGPVLLLAERDSSNSVEGDAQHDSCNAVQPPPSDGDGRRIMMVAPQPFFTVAGTPLNVLQMCRASTQLGYSVHVVTLSMGEDVVMPGLHCHRAARVPFVNRIPIGFSVSKAFCNILLAIKVVHLLRCHQFLAIHAIEEAAFFAVPLARLFGVSAIADLDSDVCEQLDRHRSILARRLVGLASVLRRNALRECTCAVTVAPSLTDLVAQISPGTRVFEIRDIPVGSATSTPDARTVERLRRAFGLDVSCSVVYTGNFDKRQGIDTLVRAMPGVLTRFAGTTLLLVGGEPQEMSEMRALARSLGVSHAVRLAGKQNPALMPAFMRLAAVLVSPRREPLVTPLKIYSYMAAGRPIVATDLPTHTQVLDSDSATLVTASPEGIASGIIRTLQDPAAASRRAERALWLIQRNHTFEHFKRRLSEVYEYVAHHAPTYVRSGR